MLLMTIAYFCKNFNKFIILGDLKSSNETNADHEYGLKLSNNKEKLKSVISKNELDFYSLMHSSSKK